MAIPAGCHGAHTPAVATLEVELLKHRLSLCLGQVRDVYVWKGGVERLLLGELRLPPSREVEHQEADYQNETYIEDQRRGRFSIQLVQPCIVLRHPSRTV
jgi:hypothetical protein